jgi:hypothetical protein
MAFALLLVAAAVASEMPWKQPPIRPANFLGLDQAPKVPPNTWKPLYATGSYYGDIPLNNGFNRAVQTSANHIVRRQCQDCPASHKDIYFKRKNGPAAFDYEGYLLRTWSDKGNKLHVDFDIYSSFEDAMNDENPWTYCNYNDKGIGFPRDCGPSGYVPYTWTSFRDSRTRRHVQYSVMLADATSTCPDTSATYGLLKKACYHMIGSNDQLIRLCHKMGGATATLQYRTATPASAPAPAPPPAPPRPRRSPTPSRAQVPRHRQSRQRQPQPPTS